jgi:hypothetical protein
MTYRDILVVSVVVLLSVLTGSLATKIIDSKEYCSLYHNTINGLDNKLKVGK